MKYWDKVKEESRYRYMLHEEHLQFVRENPEEPYSVWIETDGEEPFVAAEGSIWYSVPLAAWRELIPDIVETLYS